MNLRGWRAAGAAFLAGALAALAMPPLYWLPLAVVGMVVFVWLWETAPGPRSALLRGWAWGTGHFAVGSYWILEAFFGAAGRLRTAGPADRGRSGGDPGLLPGPGRRGVALGRAALAGAGGPLPPPHPAGDRLDRRRMAARPCLHRLSVESAGPCLGLRRAVAAGRRTVRRLRSRRLHLPRAGGAHGGVAGVARGPGGDRTCRRRGPSGDDAGRRRRPGTVAAHRPAEHPAVREMAAGARGRSTWPNWST